MQRDCLDPPLNYDVSAEENVLSAKVDGQYHDYASGCHQVIQIHDPFSINYSPQPRFNHCASLVEDKWYVYGGSGGGCASLSGRSIEEYDPAAERWHQHATTGDVPFASVGLACTAIDNKLYAFAGCTNGVENFSNAVTELDIHSMIWRTLKPCNPDDAPIPKKNAAMTACLKCLVTFGGYGIFPENKKIYQKRASYKSDGKTAKVWTNELIYFDLEKNIWNVPKVSGSAPEPCSECTLTSVGQNRAVLLGGIKQGWKCVHTLDTKILDMSDWSWITLRSNQNRPFPQPRYGHCAISYGNTENPALLILWGRDDKLSELNDGWILEISSSRHHQWKKVKFSTKMYEHCKSPYRGTTGLIMSPKGKQLVRFGGMINDKLAPLDKAYIIDIENGDEGQVSLTEWRLPKVKKVSSKTSNCPFVEDTNYPDLKFFTNSRSTKVLPAEKEQEVDMREIGLTISIPTGAIPKNSSVLIEVQPVAHGRIEMPKDCMPCSPFYNIAPCQMNENVTVKIEHSYHIESKEDSDDMVFLGVDPESSSDGIYKLKEIENVKSTFMVDDKVGQISLQNLQSLQIGKKEMTSSNSTNKDEKRMYSAMFFRDPSPPEFSSVAIFTVTQLQATYIKFVEDRILSEHPQLKKITHQPVYLAEEQVDLSILDLTNDWEVDPDKEVIYKEEIDFSDMMNIGVVPLITLEIKKLTGTPSEKKQLCHINVKGFTRDIKFKLPLSASTLHQNTPPPSPAQCLLHGGSFSSGQFQLYTSVTKKELLEASLHLRPVHSSISSEGSYVYGEGELDSMSVTSPRLPRHYSDDSELDLDDLRVLLRALREAATKWFNIGIDLAIPFDLLENIRTNPSFVVKGDREYFIRFLHLWLSQKTSSYPRTVKSLRSALKNAELDCLASQLIQRLNSSENGSSVASESLGLEGSHGPEVSDVSEKKIDLLYLESFNRRAKKFQSDIKQAATDLKTCVEKWNPNDILVTANRIASLFEEIQFSLGGSDDLQTIIKRIGAECRNLTEHKLLKLITKDNQSQTGKQLRSSIDTVENLSYMLESLATSHFKTFATKEESMELLLQNIQNLSDYLQSLLNDTDIACVGKHTMTSHFQRRKMEDTRGRSCTLPTRMYRLKQDGHPCFHQLEVELKTTYQLGSHWKAVTYALFDSFL